MWELDYEDSWVLKNWCFWTAVLEKTLESPLDFKEIQPVHSKGDQSWVFFGRTDAKAETLATSCEELTHWKRLWCWEGLGAEGEGDDRGWDGWMASPTRWTWFWVNSGSWWWTGRPGVLQFMGLQKVGHDWATELNWYQKKLNLDTELHFTKSDSKFTIHLYVKHKTIKLLENNTEENLHDLEFGNRFLHTISKALFWKKGNLYFIKLKTSDQRP